MTTLIKFSIALLVFGLCSVNTAKADDCWAYRVARGGFSPREYVPPYGIPKPYNCEDFIGFATIVYYQGNWNSETSTCESLMYSFYDEPDRCGYDSVVGNFYLHRIY